jgi:type IV secretory pathway TrbF-like protein
VDFFTKDRWKDPKGTEPRNEYRQARWAAEGEGAGATKAAWILGGCLVASTVMNVVQFTDNRAIAKLEELQFVVVEKVRDGEILSASVASGQLQTDTAIEQHFIAQWIDWVRGVPLDPVAFNMDYFKAQQHMYQKVQARVDATMKPDEKNPDRLYPEGMMNNGITRRVHVTNVTPRGGTSNSYRVDWTETLYRDSVAVGQKPATADIELCYLTPKNSVAAAQNPYGVYVCAFDWAPAPGS